MSDPRRGGAEWKEYILSGLPKEDQIAYTTLTANFHAFIQGHRHSGVKEFRRQLEAVYNFIRSSSRNESLRAMLCGIFFGRGYILVNTARFKALLCRSKSGMNNCFQKLEYDVMRPSNDIVDLFRRLLPRLDERSFNLKQWCVRLETEKNVVRFESHIPECYARRFEMNRIPQKNAETPFDLSALLNRPVMTVMNACK
jgi:hypothetical protein